MDKHFPLKLFIFSFETNQDEFQSFLEIYERRDVDYIKKQKIIEISKEKDNIFLKDNITIEKNQIEDYFKLILSSINELKNIIDKTSNKVSKRCFFLILNEINRKVLDFSKTLDINGIGNVFPELYLLNKIKLETEIESGLLFCEKCKRWFPIIETIPQMLPDEYRDEKKDIQFLKTNKNLLDEEFFKQDLKPFNM